MKDYKVQKRETVVNAISQILWSKQARRRFCQVTIGQGTGIRKYNFATYKELKGATKVLEMLLGFDDFKRVLGQDQEIKEQHRKEVAESRRKEILATEVKEELTSAKAPTKMIVRDIDAEKGGEECPTETEKDQEPEVQDQASPKAEDSKETAE